MATTETNIYNPLRPNARQASEPALRNNAR